MEPDRKVTVEKRTAIFTAETLAKMSELGVKLISGSGIVHATLEIPEARRKKALRLLSKEGFSPVEPDASASTSGEES